jgi:hypothetical protein
VLMLFDTRRRRALPGPSPLRAVICAHDLKKTVAAAALVAGRSNLPVVREFDILLTACLTLCLRLRRPVSGPRCRLCASLRCWRYVSFLPLIAYMSDPCLSECRTSMPPQAAQRIRGPCTLRSASCPRSSGSFASSHRRLRRPGCSCRRSCALLAHRPLRRSGCSRHRTCTLIALIAHSRPRLLPAHQPATVCARQAASSQGIQGSFQK